MKDKELGEQILRLLIKFRNICLQARTELHETGNIDKTTDDIVKAQDVIETAIANLIAQERRKAKIEVLEWVYSNLPKRGDRFSNAKKIDLQEIIMGLDIDIAWEIAELKEDNKKGNNNE